MRTSLLALLLVGGVAQAAIPEERLSVGVPVEVDLVGLGFGVHPEVLFRPLAPDGAFHLRAAPGLMVGPELALLPLGLGVREVAFPRRRVRPFVGLGVQLQTFVPYGTRARSRLDMYLEVGGDVVVSDRLAVGLQLSPEFGMVGGFGLGMAVRAGPTWSF